MNTITITPRFTYRYGLLLGLLPLFMVVFGIPLSDPDTPAVTFTICGVIYVILALTAIYFFRKAYTSYTFREDSVTITPFEDEVGQILYKNITNLELFQVPNSSFVSACRRKSRLILSRCFSDYNKVGRGARKAFGILIITDSLGNYGKIDLAYCANEDMHTMLKILLEKCSNVNTESEDYKVFQNIQNNTLSRNELDRYATEIAKVRFPFTPETTSQKIINYFIAGVIGMVVLYLVLVEIYLFYFSK
jgi:hypothetical protein